MAIFRTLAPLVALVPYVLAASKSCPVDSSLSCHNTAPVSDTCCFIPAGQLVLTTFWDTAPVTGPTNSWTIHGLWPDNCDGTYPASCDPNRAYTDIENILSASPATLTYMNTYWKDYNGDDEQFWSHEWSKHGTCVTTLEPTCYTNYQAKEEAVAYFDKTVSLFQSRPTYQWLSDAGITPHATKSYNLADVQAALQSKHGAPVTLKCKNGAINEVWYHYNVKGSLQSGQFVPAQPVGIQGKCSATLKYLPKA